MKPLEWFNERIGKRIYRKGNQCSCKICLHVLEHGLVIYDEIHAMYLFDMQFNPETKIDLEYYDLH